MTKNHEIDQQIKNYLLSQSRNKIIMHCHEIAGIDPINVGITISKQISLLPENNKFAFKAKAIIDDVFTSSVLEHENYGKILALTNVGILMEPDLKLDICSLLDKFSRTTTLFVHWEGEIIDGSLYFLSKENGIKIDIKKLSYIAI